MFSAAFTGSTGTAPDSQLREPSGAFWLMFDFIDLWADTLLTIYQFIYVNQKSQVF
jgi:hypothetical protein